MAELYRMLAMGVDVIHVLSMLLWGAGLPLLLWHRYERASYVYTWFAMLFVLISVTSHWTLGECFLTTLARTFWQSSGGFRDAVPFTVVLTNRIASIRPSTQMAVLAWEIAILATSLGSLWSWRKSHRQRSASFGGAWLPLNRLCPRQRGARCWREPRSGS